MKGVVVAGIGTDVGKTFISAIITEALEADYWKPVQAGNLDFTDKDFVRMHLSNNKSICHPEAFRLHTPMSPHAAADIDKVKIESEQLQFPATSNFLVVELAGGLMVPLNNALLNIDILKQWRLPVVLVSRNYLGSINHTLLSVQALRQYDVKIAGIIFNGEKNATTEDFILEFTQVPLLGHTYEEPIISKQKIIEYAAVFRPILKKLL